MTGKRVEIAGAGLVGLSVAAAFAKDGWKVRVHEASPTPRDTGGGLYVQDRGLEALRYIGLTDLAERAWKPTAFRTVIDGEPGLYEANNGTIRTMLRQDLHGLLLAAARANGVEVLTQSKAVGATEDGALLLGDGSRVTADLVVSAEGVGSSVAESLGLIQQRERLDEAVIRVLADRSNFRGGEWEHALDCWSYGQRSLRLLYTPCGGDRCYLALMAPFADTEALRMPINADLWAEAFPLVAPLLNTLANAGRFDRYGKIKLYRWSKGKVAIVGDAAHAMPSSLGQGANVGISNAIEMVKEISAADNLMTALERWEERQRPLVETIQEEAVRLVMARTLLNKRPEREPVFVPGADAALI